jgi:hypothetical protein
VGPTCHRYPLLHPHPHTARNLSFGDATRRQTSSRPQAAHRGRGCEDGVPSPAPFVGATPAARPEPRRPRARLPPCCSACRHNADLEQGSARELLPPPWATTTCGRGSPPPKPMTAPRHRRTTPLPPGRDRRLPRPPPHVAGGARLGRLGLELRCKVRDRRERPERDRREK